MTQFLQLVSYIAQLVSLQTDNRKEGLTFDSRWLLLNMNNYRKLLYSFSVMQ